MKEIKNIMVAVDSNDSVGELMDYAESIARNFKSKIWAVYVTDPDLEPEDTADKNQMLQNLCNTFLGEEVEHEAFLIEGATVEKVIQEAKKIDVDLLITGTHKHGFFYNLFSKSVSMELFKEVDIPMLTIPIDEN